MAVRLYSEFKSDNGKQYKIEIHDANWLAASTEFNVDSRGFELIYEGETDDIVSPIVSSRLQFGAYSTNATFETFVDTLKTFQENRFQIAVYKYNGTSYDLYWAGWLLQDLVSVEDTSQPYIYQMTATDGLGRLANVEYTSANTIIETNGLQLTRVTDVVKTALNNIGTSNLWGSSDVFFETAADWWETNAQTYSTSVDPIANQAFDVRYFREFDNDGNVVYSSTLEILRQVATLYNGRFYMQNGRFVFEQYGNRDTASRYVSRYTKTGTAISRTSVSDDVTINQTDDAARTSGNNWNFLPAAQKAKIHYVQKFLNPFNAFGLYRFRLATNAFTAGFIAGGSGVQLALGSTQFNFRVVGAASLTSPIFPVFKMRIRIQDSSTGTYYYYNRAYNGVVAGGAMFGTAAWSTTAGEYYFDLPPFFTSGVAIVKNPVQIVTADIPVNGEIDFRLQLHGVFRSKNGTTYTPSQPAAFDAIFVFGIQTNGASNAPGATFSSTNSEAGIDSKLTIDLGDLVIADGPIQTGHLSVYNGSAWTGSSDWRKGSSGSSLPILKLLTNETLALHVRPIEQYNGTFSLSAFFGQRLLFNSAAYLMTSGTFTANDDQWSSTLYKIETIRASVTPVDPVDDLVDRTSLIATTTTDGSSPNDIIGGRIGGMVVDIEDQKVGPFQQTGTGARITGTMNVTGDVTLDAGLDVDGVSQFNNDVNITGSVTSTGPLTGEYVQLDTTYNTTPVQGQIVWSQDDGTIDVGLNSNVTMQVGQEQFWYVKNQTGSTITKGTAVRAAGTLGASGRILAAPMIADGSVPARFLLGIAAENIVDGGEGYVTTFGKIRQLNTSAYTEGSVLWCNPAVAGGLTATEPSAPNLKLAVAFVVRSNATSGVLAVRSEIGARVSDASDVQVTSVADNDLLQYNTTTSRWENVAGTTTNIGEGTNLYYTDGRARAALSAGVGISYNNGTGVITNSAPDQVVALTASTGISVTGTYPNFTITNTAPSSGGTITGSGTTNYLSKWTSGSALGNSLVFDNGTNVGIGTATPGEKLHVAGLVRIVNSTFAGIEYHNTNGTWETYIGTENGGGGTRYNSASSQHTFYNNSSAVLRINSSGNVGINNTSPSAKLHVSDVGADIVGGNAISTSTMKGVMIQNTNNGDESVGVWFNTGGNHWSGISGQRTSSATNWSTDLRFYTHEAATADLTYSRERMRINSEGNVGIGTTAPGAKLEIAGTNSAIALSFGNSVPNNPLFINTYGGFTGIGMDQTTAGLRLAGDSGGNNLVDIGYYSSNVVAHANWVSRMRVFGNGKVGIGTTNPIGYLTIKEVDTSWELNTDADAVYQLAYNRTTSAYKIMWMRGSSFVFAPNDVEKVRIASNGNFGVGTTNPIAKFVVSDAGANGIEFNPNYLGESYIATYDRANAVYRNLNLESNEIRFRTGAATLRGIIDSSGNFGFGTITPQLTNSGRGNVTINGSSDSIAVLSIADAWKSYWYVNGSATYLSSQGTRPLYFENSAGVHMGIMGNGNVGIGTTNPYEKLDIVGNIRLGNYPDAGTKYIGYANNTFANQFIAGISIESTTLGGNYSQRLNFATHHYGVFAGVRMTLDEQGRLGIGTTAPGQKLHVDGALKLTSNPSVTADGSAAYFWNQAGVGPTIGGFKFQVQTNGSSVAMVVDENQRVGIGTTSPTAKLDVIGVGRILAADAPISSELTAKILAYSPAPYGMVFRAYSSGTNSIQVQRESNDSEMFALTLQPNGGNVGIGTTSPLAQLHVANTMRVGVGFANEAVAIFGDSGTPYWTIGRPAGSGNFRISSYAVNALEIQPTTGNVGIGTTAPGYRLHVKDSTNVGTIAIGHDTYPGLIYSNASSGEFRIDNRSSAGAGYITFYPNGQAATIGSEAMRITTSGNVGIGTTNPTPHNGSNALIIKGGSGGRAIMELHDGTSGKSVFQNVGGDTYIGQLDKGTGNGHTFLLVNGNGSNADISTSFLANGNVGIGTTSPSEKLHVSGNVIVTYNNSFQGINSIGNKAILARVSPTTGIINYAEYATAANLNGFVIGSDDARVKGNIATDSLEFVTNTSTRMFINSSGNVGIGTTSPSRNLHVAGDVQFNDQGSMPSSQYVPDGAFGIENLITNGSENVALGKPDVWLRIYVDGNAYVFPGYTQ